MFCTKCGFNLPENVKFCPNCGTTVETAQAAEQTSNTNTAQEPQFYEADVIDEDIKRLIGKKQEFYVPKFSQMKQLNKKMTWNWPAFFIGPVWFFYRKMYNYGIALMLLNMVVDGIMPDVITIAVAAVVGAFANYIYMDYLEKQSLQMKSMPETTKETFIKEKGGTSGVAILVCFVISAVLSALVNLIF